MNEGWKGKAVLIDSCAIAQESGKTILSATVQFAAEDGTVHAIARHSFLLDPEVQEDETTTAAAALLTALRKRVEAIHFAHPHSAENKVLKGITESLRRESDEPGTPG